MNLRISLALMWEACGYGTSCRHEYRRLQVMQAPSRERGVAYPTAADFWSGIARMRARRKTLWTQLHQKKVSCTIRWRLLFSEILISPRTIVDTIRANIDLNLWFAGFNTLLHLHPYCRIGAT
jgi:hypothetical protein